MNTTLHLLSVARACALLCASLSLPLAALAAGPTPPSIAPDATSLTLGEVRVTAPALGPLSSRQVLTSVDIVPGSQVQARQVDQSWELFKLVPGVLITEFKQGTTSGKLSLRGFNGEGNVNAVKLLIDGVPSNSNDGNMPYLDMVSPLEIEQMEVVRGTNDPRWGLHAIGGNVQLITRQGGNDGEARVTVGSFGVREVQVAKAVESPTGWSENYFVGFRDSTGFRDHARQDKQTLSGKWFYTPQHGRWTAGFTARAYNAGAEEAGYLTADQRRDDPRQSPAWNGSDQDRRRMNQMSLRAEGSAADDLSWSLRGYRNQLDDDRFVRFSESASQQERVVQEVHQGLIGTLTWRVSPRLQLEGGVQREWQDNESRRYRTSNQVVLAQTRDQVFKLDNTGAYLQGVIQPVASLTVTPSWRGDVFGGWIEDRLNRTFFRINDYGLISQPKLSLAWGLAAGHQLYANAGRSFQIGVGAASYLSAQRQTDLQPSINTGWELGWKFKPLPWLEGRLATWAQTATDEVYRKLNDPANDSANLGRTRRHAHDLQLNATFNPQLSAWASLALQRAVVREPDPAQPLTAGKEVDHVPHALASLGARWLPAADWTVNASVRAQSSYFIEPTNLQGRYGQFVVADLAVAHRISDRLSVDAQVKNLFDRDHAYVWWDGAQSLHAPADGRAVYVSASLRF